MKRVLLFAFVVGSPVLFAQTMPQQGSGNARYATDAYPGFDLENTNLTTKRKEPKWFSFWNGVDRKTASEQFTYCQELLAAGNDAKAAKQLDALVREWPTAPEAAKAQRQYADILLEKLGETEDAFEAYCYLLDFYSLQCDYQAIADKLYKVAGVLKLEGKEIMFVRFANTVDVRRAYEACILRAPGAKWATEAMLIVAQLREEEGKFAEAVKVYENLRNLHPNTPEALTAVFREADLRMRILREHEYNRARCIDTVNFMKLALRTCRPDDAMAIQEFMSEAETLMENETYRAAAFYDSRTRTTRSAVAAYEKYLESYPNGAHADVVRARLEVLKGESRK